KQNPHEFTTPTKHLHPPTVQLAVVAHRFRPAAEPAQEARRPALSPAARSLRGSDARVPRTARVAAPHHPDDARVKSRQFADSPARATPLESATQVGPRPTAP